MAEQKKTQKGFGGCCEGMPFADIMRKVMEAKKTGQPFDRGEMMSQMMEMRGGARERKERPSQETGKDSVPNG